MYFQTDEVAWSQAPVSDLWLMDKLILSKSLGYTCGPKGVNVPRPGKYIVRPIVNPSGMGLGTYSAFFKDTTDSIPHGFFWCEFFEGDHVSIDYSFGKEVLHVRGYRDKRRFDRWSLWEKEHFKIFPLSSLLRPYAEKYERFNVEAIGGKVIEVHLRGNPDFEGHDSDYVKPLYFGEPLELGSGERFIDAPDGARKGFIIRK